VAKYYNRLTGEAREWATENKIPIGERCVRVNGRRRMAEAEVDKVAGNGSFGFSSRRKRDEDDDVKMTEGMYGQFKSGRKTVARRRKMAHNTWTKDEIRKAQMDEFDLEQARKEADRKRSIQRAKEQEIKRAIRKQNRNSKARRGHSKSKKGSQR